MSKLTGRASPGVWVHGDWAAIDDDGLWYILGRSDDTIKIAGKRLGPAEVESVLVEHPAVIEAAAIGVPDASKGQALACFCVLRPGFSGSDTLGDELKTLVATRLGKPLRPQAVEFVQELPEDPERKGHAAGDSIRVSRSGRGRSVVARKPARGGRDQKSSTVRAGFSVRVG